VEERARGTATSSKATPASKNVSCERTSSKLNSDEALMGTSEENSPEKSALAQTETSHTSARTSTKIGSQQSIEPTATSIAGREPGRHKAKEDIAIKEPGAAVLIDTSTSPDGKPVNDANPTRQDSATSTARRVTGRTANVRIGAVEP
ncbi:hypothetical protein MTO96_034239, partial [Rhipicephalus appendiculatus]